MIPENAGICFFERNRDASVVIGHLYLNFWQIHKNSNSNK
jgi:hypothetical protein